MNTYAVKYIDGVDLRVSYVQGKNQSDAGTKFKKEFPNINEDSILDVTIVKLNSNEFGTTIFLAKFASFIGWVCVIIGILVAMSIAYLGTGINLIMFGFALVVLGQMNRAIAENTNYTKQILDELRFKK